MKKATILFEVTEKTTVVTAIGLNGIPNKFEITGTDEEKDFIALLKKLQEYQLTKEIMSALDVENWEVVSSGKAE